MGSDHALLAMRRLRLDGYPNVMVVPLNDFDRNFNTTVVLPELFKEAHLKMVCVFSTVTVE